MGLSPSVDALPPAAWFVAVRRRLSGWFKRNARDLPWRRHSDPYAIWLSEVMLQQTTVAMATPYFERFLQRLPTIADLAAADEHEVLRLWEGLGYYRRARQLHQTARQIVAEHGGVFPREMDALRRLPGVGRYTAGAVLSLAFDQPQPIIEANTTRVWSRLLAFDGDPSSRDGQRLLWAAATAVLPPRRGARSLNLALMDLGAGVCAVRGPQCEVCPLAALCMARAQGRQCELPRPKAIAAPTAVREAAVVVRRRGRVLLLRNDGGGRWAGLWDFPRFAIKATGDAALRRELAERVAQMTGLQVVAGDLLATLRHSVTRFRITLVCYQAECLAGDRAKCSTGEMRWVRPSELTNFALNVTARKLARLLLR